MESYHNVYFTFRWEKKECSLRTSNKSKKESLSKSCNCNSKDKWKSLLFSDDEDLCPYLKGYFNSEGITHCTTYASNLLFYDHKGTQNNISLTWNLNNRRYILELKKLYAYYFDYGFGILYVQYVNSEQNQLSPDDIFYIDYLSKYIDFLINIDCTSYMLDQLPWLCDFDREKKHPDPTLRKLERHQVLVDYVAACDESYNIISYNSEAVYSYVEYVSDEVVDYILANDELSRKDEKYDLFLMQFDFDSILSPIKKINDRKLLLTTCTSLVLCYDLSDMGVITIGKSSCLTVRKEKHLKLSCLSDRFNTIILLLLLQGDMVVFLNVQLSRLSKQKKYNEEIIALYENYLTFYNTFDFNDVSQNVIVNRCYLKMKEVCNLQAMKDENRAKVNELFQYASMVENSLQSDMANKLSIIALVYLPAMLISGLFGMNDKVVGDSFSQQFLIILILSIIFLFFVLCRNIICRLFMTLYRGMVNLLKKVGGALKKNM